MTTTFQTVPIFELDPNTNAASGASCGTCAYGLTNGTKLQCRANPPPAFMAPADSGTRPPNTFEAVWPTVLATEWCGVWKDAAGAQALPRYAVVWRHGPGPNQATVVSEGYGTLTAANAALALIVAAFGGSGIVLPSN